MISQVVESARALVDSDIDALELRIGLQLPQELRRFLLNHNGGRPRPNAFPIVGLEKNPFGAIQIFFGIDDEIESCNLEWNREVMSGRLPDNLLAIGCDDGGDLICISLYGDDAGAILFWDCHSELNEPSYDNVYRVAGSFHEFVEKIQDVPIDGQK